MLARLKNAVRQRSPSLYYRLGKFKERLVGRSFDHYFDAALPALRVPEACVTALAARCPAYVDTVLILGCAPGRDFKPFEKTHALWGIDIAPVARINWQCDTARLRYEQLTLKQFIRLLERDGADLARTLVYASATLMLISRRWQQRLYAALKANGCRNFIFQDYAQDHPDFGLTRGRECFQLPLDDFKQMRFRDGPNEPIAFVRLAHTSGGASSASISATLGAQPIASTTSRPRTGCSTTQRTASVC
jgi:hypothetical protein